jgi:hypothetical protein
LNEEPIDIIHLGQLLIDEGFNPESFSLRDEHKDEALCLRQTDKEWCIFYSERGLQTGKICFVEEAQACQEFLTKMRSDPTTRLSWKSGFGY